MKERKLIALGMAGMLSLSGLFTFSGIEAEAKLPDNQLVIDFEDLGTEAQSLTGKYQNCNFGNRGWNTGAVDGGVKLWADSFTKDGQVNKIAIPYGKIFRGFSAKCSESATIKVVSGSETNTFEIGATEKEFTTDFRTNQMAVYLVIECAKGTSDVKLDDLILEEVDISKLNVSQGKPTSTSGDSERPASNGNDGDENTMWVNNGAGADKWWQVDLQEAYTISDYELVFEKEESNPWKYKVEASADGENFDMLSDKTENTDSAKVQTGEVSAETKYRYVRVTITGLPAETYWAGFAEFKVYTKDIMSNVAQGKSTSQSGGYNSSDLAVDGDVTTFGGNTDTFPYWWTVDLGDTYNVKEVEIEWEDLKDGDTNIAEDWKYKIEYSADGGSTWEELVDYTSETPYTDPETSVVQNEACDIECNAFKVTITDKPPKRPLAWAVLPEFRAFAVDTHIPEEEGQNINIDIAYGQPVKASSVAEGYKASNVTDYDSASTWKPVSEDDTAYLQIDLDREYNIQNHKVEFTSAVSSYKFYVSMDNDTWTEVSDVSADQADKTVDIEVTTAKYVRFEFAGQSEDLEVKEIHFDGLDAGVLGEKKILVLAPHEDDEMLMAGGVMNRAAEVGDEVKVLLATNGDYNGKSTGKGRIVETINALEVIGVESEDIMFMGYADTGGLGGAQTYQDSFLYKMYTADDTQVFKSRWGNEYTYGNPNAKQDYHYEVTGEHALYTRKNFLNDLEYAISTYKPTDIYVPSRYDMHFDHAYFDLFAIEAIQNIQAEDPSYNPTLHESIIHSCAGDSNWPIVNSDEKGIRALNMPEGLEELTMFNWDERENINVPYAMRQVPFAFNLKDQALRLYTSQYYDYIGSFAKVNEIFWSRDFSSFAKEAEITASSECANEDRKIDQSAVKAVDGVRDGAAEGLPYDHPRFPHAEWVSDKETTGAWINLEFDNEKEIKKVVLYDRPDMDNQILEGKLIFDDNSEIIVGELPNNGEPLEVQVDKNSKNVKFVVTKVSDSTESVGLAEIEVY
ncbi:discoidin domain-containing protein [[Clostridium] scindens]|uniref:discoidin domain-containing protein n=1 Tax=Clostridium scindens (strain JCM 10418 / VPI 12708) TaxID=29347 RepID=UPI002E7A0D9A|nr:discoidin domain-containing protein [[Clostridium] scindens]MEE0649275.1 discoidin domain-containing protein [[Clostridium] scindens]